MINLIIKWQKWEIEFQGEKISMELLPLKVGTNLLLTPFFIRIEEQDNKGKALGIGKKDVTVDQDKLSQYIIESTRLETELQNVCRDIFPSHVRDIQGMTINGKPVDPIILCEEPIFSTLVLQIVTQLYKISRITAEQAKN